LGNKTSYAVISVLNKTLGKPALVQWATISAAARLRLIVWCRDCKHRVEPDPAEIAERYGAEMNVPAGARGCVARNAAVVMSTWW